MGFLRDQIKRAQDQLSGLNASQRMLVAALVVIMAMTMYFWAMYAGKAEMEVLADQPMSQEEIGPIIAELRNKKIEFKVAGDRILVPADQRFELWVMLSYAQVLPQDSKSAFNDLIDKLSGNPFMSRSRESALFLQAKQATLSQVLRRWPGVTYAMVVIDDTVERGFNRVDPSATVSLTLRKGESADRKLAEAAADFVAGTVARLDRGRIKVLIDGASFPIHSKDGRSPGVGGDQWLEDVQKSERYYTEKVKAYLSWIEGVMTAVSVSPNFKMTEKLTHQVTPTNVLVKPLHEESTNGETRSDHKDSGEPGVVSNGPLKTNDAPSAGDKNTQTTETNKTDNVVAFGHIDEKTVSNGGEAPPQSATVMIPRSYFLRGYQTKFGKDKEPNVIVLDAFIAEELKPIRDGVKACLMLNTDEAVHVGAYADSMPIAGGSVPQAAGAPWSMLLTDHVKEVALGVLALVSLFMVSNMVKKTMPVPVAAAPPAPKLPPPTLEATEEAVGEATEGDPMLDGMEVDEDSVKAQQMLGQVSELVGENPDAAATLVKRWLNRT